MRVLVTGATGWIGSAVVDELTGRGHEVVGLARSDASIATLQKKGVAVVKGDLDDVQTLSRATRDADAVVHLANKHDWDDRAASNRAERTAVQALGNALSGSGRRFLIASGVAGLTVGRPATEDDPSPFIGPEAARGGSEALCLEFEDNGVHPIIVRLAPTVHGAGDTQFMSMITTVALKHRVSAYVGDGTTGWSAVHRDDAARLVAQGLEIAPAGAILHAVSEEHVTARAIAAAIGRAHTLPTISIQPSAASEHFGFVGPLFATDFPASSVTTQTHYDWRPRSRGLIEDIDAGAYGPIKPHDPERPKA